MESGLERQVGGIDRSVRHPAFASAIPATWRRFLPGSSYLTYPNIILSMPSLAILCKTVTLNHSLHPSSSLDIYS